MPISSSARMQHYSLISFTNPQLLIFNTVENVLPKNAFCIRRKIFKLSNRSLFEGMLSGSVLTYQSPSVHIVLVCFMLMELPNATFKTPLFKEQLISYCRLTILICLTHTFFTLSYMFYLVWYVNGRNA